MKGGITMTNQTRKQVIKSLVYGEDSSLIIAGLSVSEEDIASITPEEIAETKQYLIQEGFINE